METLLEIDHTVFLWLNNWVGHWALVDVVTRLLVSDYFVPALLSISLLGMWFWGKDTKERESRQRAAIRAMIALGIANLAVLVLNEHYFRPRPFVEYDVAMLFYQPTDSSFPANPAALSFAVAHSVWQGSRGVGKLSFLLASLWGISRVFAGVFYPLDVVAGALIGISVSIAVGVALRLIEPIPTLVLRLARVFHLA